MSGTLVVVPTPIGNLGDITLRSLDALRGADAIYSEDTRVTQRLLAAFDIPSRSRLHRLDENVMEEQAHRALERVATGETVAYCTDAGMPGVSDPGMRLVALARERGIDVEVLPGASAAVCAYVASGTPSTSFYFGGFLPRKQSERISVLEALSGIDSALIFYESPHRISASLEAISKVFPTRRVTVCRELTKMHEEVACGISGDISAEFANRDSSEGIKGECAIVIDAPSKEESKASEAESRSLAKHLAERLLQEGTTPKDAAKRIASEFGIPRNDAYGMVLACKEENAR